MEEIRKERKQWKNKMQNRTRQQLFRDRQKAKREAGKAKQKGVKMVKLSAHGSGDRNAIKDFASLS